MSLNIKKSFFIKQSAKDNNINNKPNKSLTLQKKNDLLDYATLKKIHGFQLDLDLHQYKFSNDSALISELKKLNEDTKKLKASDKSKESESISSSRNNNKSKELDNNITFGRNNETILKCLSQYQNFIKYMKFHNVSTDLIEKICPFLLHKHIPKDSYLFKEKDKINFFFGVINGKIGLRTFDPYYILESKRKNENEEIHTEKIYIIKKKKIIPKEENKNKDINDSKKNNLNNNDYNIDSKDKNDLKSYENEEIKIFEEKQNNKFFEINYENIPGINKYLKEGYDARILKKGDCYGIYNLLNNKDYDINGIALENTDIFYLEKDYFYKYLLTPISRIDLERKYIINKLIPSIPLELIMNLKPEVYDNNQIIYTEFDFAFECIFIYKGSAELKKDFSAKSKADIYEHKNILKTISKIDEGGIAGLEVCKGPTSFYDNTLMVTDAKTIIYRINIYDLKGKKHTSKSIKKFFTQLYEQQKIFLQKTEEKNQEYKENYKISQKMEKPKFNYSNFFNVIFKDVNPPYKFKKNKLPHYQLKKLNLENQSNSNKKIKLNILNTFYNKTSNNRYKTIDSQKKLKSNFFALYNNRDKKKYNIYSRYMSRNDEEKGLPTFNSFNIYNSLSSSSKIKNQKQMSVLPQESKFNSINDNNINYNAKNSFSRKDAQKSYDLSFPKLYKNYSTKNKNKIISKKFENNKFHRINSVDKCIYDSGDFQIPFVSLSNNSIKNINKIKNLTHYAHLKKLILEKKFLC